MLPETSAPARERGHFLRGLAGRLLGIPLLGWVLPGIAMLGLAACGSRGPAPVPEPDWVTSRTLAEYPASRYLVGVGLSNTPQKAAALREAADRAAADIAAQIEVQVRSEITTLVNETLEITGTQRRGRSLTQLSENLQLSAEADFVGLRQVAQHHDPAGGPTAVMVVVDRRDQARRLLQQVGQLDTRIRQWSESAARQSAAGRAFQASTLLRRVQAALLERVALASRANWILPGSVPAAAKPTLAEALQREAAAAERVLVWIACRHQAGGQEQDAGSLEQYCLSTLRDRGFRAQPVTQARAGIFKSWRDPEALRALRSSGEAQSLLLLLDAESSRHDVGEAELIRVVSKGSARLVDVASGELLVSVSSDAGPQRRSPQIGMVRHFGRLLRDSMDELAKMLLERVMERMS
jgi:predicted small lipoprotein YifL